ncbi:hypothetical protein H2199_003228 [Coniosporium tulheliwenetii]|uniref:Uncharacterized protein n=1 Tax=Coniosporium tulheliwenetii TaxID=3383036 RepID=A0ACC2ZBR4_9PEZI|nr:hypothetical protein H2199_003228 [Cladosporium sp. JES 115]
MDGREKRKKQRGMPRRSRQQPHSSRNTVTPSTEEQATGGVRSKGGRENDETAVHPFKSGRNSRETTGNTISRDHTVDIKELSRRVLSSTLESQSEKPQSKTIPEEEEDFVFAADNRNVQAGPPSNSQGNHTLQDYTMQLMLLEQQNMKRLLMARQEREHELSLNQPSPDSGNKESERASLSLSLGILLREVMLCNTYNLLHFDPSPSTGYVVRKGLNKHLTLEPLEQAASPADDEAWYTSSEREEPDEHPEMPGQEATIAFFTGSTAQTPRDLQGSVKADLILSLMTRK